MKINEKLRDAGGQVVFNTPQPKKVSSYMRYQLSNVVNFNEEQFYN